MSEDKDTLIPPNDIKELLEWQSQVLKPRKPLSDEDAIHFWNVVKNVLNRSVWRDGVGQFSQIVIELEEGVGLRIQGPSSRSKLLVDAVPFDFGSFDGWEEKTLEAKRMLDVLSVDADIASEVTVDELSGLEQKVSPVDPEVLAIEPVWDGDDWGEDIFALDTPDDQVGNDDVKPDPIELQSLEADLLEMPENVPFEVVEDFDSGKEPQIPQVVTVKLGEGNTGNMGRSEKRQWPSKGDSQGTEATLNLLRSRKELNNLPDEALKIISDWLTNGEQNNFYYVKSQLEKTKLDVKEEPTFQVDDVTCALITLYTLNESTREFQSLIGSINAKTIASRKTEFGSGSKSETLLVSKMNPNEKSYFILYRGKPTSQGFGILSF